MAKIKIPAARVQQGALILYATSMKVKELVADGFYNVETLDPEDTNDKGFQRLLNKARAKKLADYILKGQDSQDAFLPTSVFLATDKSIDFDEQNNTIEFDTVSVGPFSVVDGQHRLEGLKMAAEKDCRVHNFAIPVNIAINLALPPVLWTHRRVNDIRLKLGGVEWKGRGNTVSLTRSLSLRL